MCVIVLREYPQQGWPEVAPMDLSRPEAFRSGTEALVWPGSGRFEPLIGRRCPFFCCRRQPQAWKLVNGSRDAAKNSSADRQTQKHDAHPSKPGSTQGFSIIAYVVANAVKQPPSWPSQRLLRRKKRSSQRHHRAHARLWKSPGVLCRICSLWDPG